MNIEDIKKNLNCLPHKPGVYIFKDKKKKFLYVGKALSLKNRVSSYFTTTAQGNPKITLMLKKAEEIDWIITDTELEAVMLEYNLIKANRPGFNIKFRDDKRFPVIKLHIQEKFPYITVARQKIKDGSKYFGPYASTAAMRHTLKLLRKVFQIRPCNKKFTDKKIKPCLYYHIQECSAPCAGLIEEGQYRKLVDALLAFFEGKGKEILYELKQRMKVEADNYNFEQAAILRDRIRYLERFLEKQKITSDAEIDEDIINLAMRQGMVCLMVFQIRQGRITGKEHFILEAGLDNQPEEILSFFIKQYYGEFKAFPQNIVLPFLPADKDIVLKWLLQKNKMNIEFIIPEKGEKKKLLELVKRNASLILEQAISGERRRQYRQLEELKSALRLSFIPQRIEAYDISNIHGKYATGSMVVFEEGIPNKAHYRHFKIKSPPQPDDITMIKEVLRRRFLHLKENLSDTSFASLPDMILIDGGKGQLKAALEVTKEVSLEKIKVIALAKKEELIFEDNRLEPVKLPLTSPALLLLKQIRNEAHRFAISYHRKRRRLAVTASELDNIKGIGMARKERLLRYFGSVENIKKASLEEIKQALGGQEKLAQQIMEYLRGIFKIDI